MTGLRMTTRRRWIVRSVPGKLPAKGQRQKRLLPKRVALSCFGVGIDFRKSSHSFVPACETGCALNRQSGGGMRFFHFFVLFFPIMFVALKAGARGQVTPDGNSS